MSNKYPTLSKAGFKVPASMAGTFGSGAYEGASSNRRLRGWTSASNDGPNTVIDANLSTLRARSRDAVRNNPYARNAMESYCSNLVGRGIRPRWKIKDKALKKKVQAEWDRWVNSADADGMFDFYGIQTLVMRTVFQGGEALTRFRPRRLSDGLNVPLQLQVLEGDMMCELYDGRRPGGAAIRMGIELNALGQRTHYHLYKEHPSDDALLAANLSKVRVPARDILHVYRVDRPGQLRGVPWLTPVLARMYLLDLYEDAELDRKKTAALFAAFITSQSPEDGIINLGGREVDEDRFGRGFVDLEPGMMQYLLPGEDIRFSEPADVGGTYEVWLKQQLRAIAAGIGVTYEQLTGDLRGVNYSSIRAGMLEFRRKCEQIQRNMIIYQFCQKVAERWMDYAVAAGTLDIPDYNENRAEYVAIEWQADGWDWVDPSKDVKAAIEEINAGLNSREAVTARRGRNIEDIDQDAAEAMEREERLGLTYTTSNSFRGGETEEEEPEEAEENPDADENEEEKPDEDDKAGERSE